MLKPLQFANLNIRDSLLILYLREEQVYVDPLAEALKDDPSLQHL